MRQAWLGDQGEVGGKGQGRELPPQEGGAPAGACVQGEGTEVEVQGQGRSPTRKPYSEAVLQTPAAPVDVSCQGRASPPSLVESREGAGYIPDRHETAHLEAAHGRARWAQQRGHGAILGQERLTLLLPV